MIKITTYYKPRSGKTPIEALLVMKEKVDEILNTVKWKNGLEIGNLEKVHEIITKNPNPNMGDSVDAVYTARGLVKLENKKEEELFELKLFVSPEGEEKFSFVAPATGGRDISINDLSAEEFYKKLNEL